jgi:hopanoid biosynthesis associated protein HpnK
MRRVIINADDFGLSPGVNRGILSAFREGVLTSTTMLVNLASFEDAVSLALANPDLPVGIHLSLLWGPPVSDPGAVPSLVEHDGRFPLSLTVLAQRYFLGVLQLEQVRTEFGAQIERFRGAGLTPTHVDTHKHVHCLPGVLDALAQAAADQGIPCVRFPYEGGIEASDAASADSAPPRSLQAIVKSRIVAYFCRNGRSTLERHGLRTTDHFAGIEYMDHLDGAAVRFILGNLREGVTELMCHPGYDDDLAREYSTTPPPRETELAALKDATLRELLTTRGVELTSYRDL